jgi:proteasome lid subunit RPN8/RPN11
MLSSADPDYISKMSGPEYANSDGKTQYIGEWHTHPQITPEASEMDLASLEEIADSKGDYCKMMILGSKFFTLKG